MKKKIALTVVLGLFIGFGIYFVVVLLSNYIKGMRIVINFGAMEGDVLALVLEALKIIFVVISILIATKNILKIWEKEIQQVSFSYEEYKQQKEKKKEEKRQNKLNKLEEKIKKYKN